MASNLGNGPATGDNSNGMIDGALLQNYRERAVKLMIEQKKLGKALTELCKECDEAGACSKKELRRLAREKLMDSAVLSSQLERMVQLRLALGDEPSTQGESVIRLRGRPKKKSDELDGGWHLGAEPPPAA